MQEIERELVEKAGQGDERAFRKLYDRTSGYVYAIAYRVMGRKHDADEVTQDVFVKVYRNLRSFKFESAFKTWLYRITVNTALNYAKKRGRVRGHEIEDEDGQEAVSEPDVFKNIQAVENERVVKEFLDRLNPDQRVCIVLREIDGMEYQAIAEILAVNINTVRSRLKRAREVLMALGKREVRAYEV